MLLINSSDVRFWPAPEDPLSHQPKFLEYLSNSYELISTFSLSQKAEATNLWCELTDFSNRVCLLVQEKNIYSVWGLTDREIDLPNTSANNTSSVDRAVLLNISHHFCHFFWIVIVDLAGKERAQSFGQEIINSEIPIASWPELHSASPLAEIPDMNITPATLGEITKVSNTFQQIATQYLGQGLTQQIIKDLTINLNILSPVTL